MQESLVFGWSHRGDDVQPNYWQKNILLWFNYLLKNTFTKVLT